MRFQLENLKTARGLNKKAVKSNVPVRPPPSSTSLRCSCPRPPRSGPEPQRRSLCSRTAAERGRSGVPAPQSTRWSPHGPVAALCIRRSGLRLQPLSLQCCYADAQRLPPSSTCSARVLFCCAFSKLAKKPINPGSARIHGEKAWNSLLLCYCYCSGYDPKD